MPASCIYELVRKTQRIGQIYSGTVVLVIDSDRLFETNEGACLIHVNDAQVNLEVESTAYYGSAHPIFTFPC